MSQLIAGMYEIQNKIGAGGGGVVYLGRHIRLDKTVVLKADKRRLSAGTETLRREVDMLKNLSHTYIPQVYDFVQEDGVVYTVMDYIEGESLDKLLGRKQIPTQPQVISWACQLLEALSYLHGRPPHGILHGDIKPANIMLRPNGDVCLIDFNIALALGEDGAVKVGFSRGYASPEHYGADYISANRPAAVGLFTGTDNKADHRRAKDDRTEPYINGSPKDTDVTMADADVTSVDTDATRADTKPQTVSGSSSVSGVSTASGKKGILLDVRSDIYSLGATLYHLISGTKPAQDAREVVALGAEVCSPAVSAILQKAMAPMPEDRYQTAEEMLNAFRALHRRDIRVLRHKRRIAASVVSLSILFLAGGASTFIGLKQLEQRQEALVLSEYSANALAEGDVSGAVRYAMQAIPTGKSIFNAPVTAQAQKALTDALGVYDLSDGFKALGVVELPAAPFDVAASPDGTRFAVVYAYEVAVYDTFSGEKIVTLPAQKSALADVVFLDNSRIVYAGNKGVTAYDLDGQKELWTGDEATNLALSGDKTVVAAVNRAESRVVLYRVTDGIKTGERDFGGRHLSVPVNDIFADAGDNVFALNQDGSFLGVSFSNGGLEVLDLKNPDGDLILYEESDYVHFEGGFNGRYFAFAADKSSGSLFGVIDTLEAEYLGGAEAQNNFHLKADEGGIYLTSGNLLVRFEPETLKQIELAYTDNVNITGFSVGERYVLTATDDNCFSFYDSGANLMSSESGEENCDFALLTDRYALIGNRNAPVLRRLALEDHADAQILSYDARYQHDEARISGDGRTVMLFNYQSFRIYNMAGKLLKEERLPAAEYIYDQQFRKEETGSWLEVIWYDGTVRCYSAADGNLISEIVGEAPSKDLYEEFYTDRYRFASSLHGSPEVYDLKSGELAAILEPDSYLTYVTQAGDYIITEYISAAGERYGLLLDDKLQTLAVLPGLCDYASGSLVFDYESGNLRQSRLYSLQELAALGETYISTN